MGSGSGLGSTGIQCPAFTSRDRLLGAAEMASGSGDRYSSQLCSAYAASGSSGREDDDDDEENDEAIVTVGRIVLPAAPAATVEGLECRCGPD